MNLVDAQQARRVLDRLVWFELSPVLWKKIKTGLSAWRVQSVAVKLIVDREREIEAFKEEEYWTIKSIFNDPNFEANLFKYKTEDIELHSEEEANKVLDALSDKYIVESIDKKEKKRKSKFPFITSTLQQEASRKLGFSVSRTMQVAQKLYEAGHITYMRTDAVNLSDFAINAAKAEICSFSR